MATPTYTALATTTLSGGETSVTFSSIPASYRDLILVCNATYTSGIIDLTLNSDSSNRTAVYAYGYPTSNTNSYTDTKFQGISSGDLDRLHIYQIMDYSATDKHKTILMRHNYPQAVVSMAAGRWASTAAVNTITLTKLSVSFASGSVISLYGIAS